jgi:hypothetical protein
MTGLYGDGTTIVPEVSLVMSEADHILHGCDIVKGYKPAAMQVNSLLTRGRVVASFRQPTPERKESKCFLSD